MDIFVSYSRQDVEAVREIRDALGRLGHEVWMDRELRGGQQWWDVILGQIRSCDVFMFALSPDSAQSQACPSEIAYAVDTLRPLLPVMVRTADVRDFPKAISDVQFVDYTTRDTNSVVDLISALTRLPLSTALPDPLPSPPPAPGIIWDDLTKKVAADSLGFKEQSALLTEIRARSGSPDDAPMAVKLLNKFRRRPDIAEAVGRDIDRLLGELNQMMIESSSSTDASQTHGSAPDDEKPASRPSPVVPDPETVVTEATRPASTSNGGSASQRHRFIAPGLDLGKIADRLQNWLSGQKMQSQVMESDGALVVQGRSESKFGRAIGAGVAFSVKMWTEGDELVVEIGQMQWADKGAAAAVGVLVFWPALIPAIVGGVKQKTLPTKALQIIEAAIPDLT